MEVTNVDSLYEKMGFIGENKLKYVKKLLQSHASPVKTIEHAPFLLLLSIPHQIELDELYILYEKVINGTIRINHKVQNGYITRLETNYI